jgi:hypothetical protein
MKSGILKKHFSNKERRKGMKKSMYLSLALLLLTASGGWAYDFNDTALVQPWNGSSPYGATWTDVIGDPTVYNTMGANWNGSSSTLSIFTNWNPGKDGDLVPQVKTADLFIYDLSKSTTFAIQLDTKTGTGNVYGNPTTITTSVDIFKSITSLIYGGQFNQASPSLVPVQGTGGTSMGTTSVAWSSTDIFAVNNAVDVNLSGLGLGNDQWSFVWATATCANDVVEGGGTPVPEPGSMLLLGLGIAGLGVCGRRAVRK